MLSAPFARTRWLVPAAVLGVAALAIVLLWVAFAAELRKDRDRARQEAEIRLESGAAALAEQAERMLTGINIAALYLRHAWVHNHDRFAEVVDTLRPASAPDVGVNVMINDAAGWMVFSTYPPSPGPMNFAEREHFRAQVHSDTDALFVSKPVMGKISQRMMIPCSRKLLDADGAFAGIAVIAIAPEDLFTLDPNLELGAGGGATLIGLHDRVVRASAANMPDTAPPAGAELDADRPYFSGASQGVFAATGVRDGRERLYAFRRLRQFPLVMVVSDTLDGIHAATAPRRRELSLFTSAASLAIAGFALVLAHFIHTLAGRSRALDDARQRREAILTSAGEGICGFGRDGRVTFINPAARAMLGWDQSDDGTRRALAAHLRALPLGGEHKTELRRGDGSLFPAEVSSAAMPDTGDSDGAVMVFRDVTGAMTAERQLREQSDALARSNAELEQFAYVASHDLREPLRMISSFLTLLEKRLGPGLDQDCRDFLHFARDGAQRMDRLVLDLLEYSRIGRLQRPMTPVDLNAVLAEVRTNLSAALAESGGALHADTLPTVTGDAQELTRLLQNLVGNALKYHAAERPPQVTVSARRDGDFWRVEVADNGIGIAPEHHDRVFGVFQRLHARDQYDGTGIGLAICKKVVERHGGTIGLSSEPGRGTCFHFTLPAR